MGVRVGNWQKLIGGEIKVQSGCDILRTEGEPLRSGSVLTLVTGEPRK